MKIIIGTFSSPFPGGYAAWDNDKHVLSTIEMGNTMTAHGEIPCVVNYPIYNASVDEVHAGDIATAVQLCSRYLGNFEPIPELRGLLNYNPPPPDLPIADPRPAWRDEL